MELDAGRDEESPIKEKYRPFHDCKGHDLARCYVFGKKTFEEKTQWLTEAKLCFCCLLGVTLPKNARQTSDVTDAAVASIKRYFIWRDVLSKQFKMGR